MGNNGLSILVMVRASALRTVLGQISTTDCGVIGSDHPNVQWDNVSCQVSAGTFQPQLALWGSRIRPLLCPMGKNRLSLICRSSTRAPSYTYIWGHGLATTHVVGWSDPIIALSHGKQWFVSLCRVMYMWADLACTISRCVVGSDHRCTSYIDLYFVFPSTPSMVGPRFKFRVAAARSTSADLMEAPTRPFS